MKKKNVKTIGRYEIRETLGRGSMGIVYKVFIPVIKKITALKVLQPSPQLIQKMGTEWVREQFVREASVMASVSHPHVVEVFNFEQEGDRMFYLMEYLCQNLGLYIRETYWAEDASRIVPAKQAVRFSTQVLKGLSRLHHSGIVHRDIKPFNVMLTDEGDVKIADFGLSRKRGESSMLNKSSSDDPLFIGTRYYAAPEQVDAPESADHRADLYSTGVLLYRMLTGRLPRKDIKSPSQINPDLDASWDRFLFKAMAQEPQNRFQDANVMADDMQKVLDTFIKKKSGECQAPGDFFEDNNPSLKNKPQQELSQLRSTPEKVIARRARGVFNLDDLERPNIYHENRLEQLNSLVVVDHSTRLVWQQSGSPYPMNLKAAMEYIEKLGTEGFAGYKDWRMPTVDELLSLLNPPPPGENFCFEPVFSNDQKGIWSSDSRSFKASWVVNAEMGFVMSSDIMNYFYVKGVCCPSTI